MQRGFTSIILLVGILALGIVAGGIYLWQIHCPAGNVYTSVGCRGTGLILPSPLPKPISKATPTNETADLKTFNSQYAEIAFNYPANWKIKDELSKNVHTNEDAQTIEVQDENGKLVMYLVRPDYPNGCDGPIQSGEVKLFIGKEEQTLKRVCGFYLGKHKDFYAMVFFVGTPSEQAGKDLLKSLK